MKYSLLMIEILICLHNHCNQSIACIYKTVQLELRKFSHIYISTSIRIVHNYSYVIQMLCNNMATVEKANGG